MQRYSTREQIKHCKLTQRCPHSLLSPKHRSEFLHGSKLTNEISIYTTESSTSHLYMPKNLGRRRLATANSLHAVVCTLASHSRCRLAGAGAEHNSVNQYSPIVYGTFNFARVERHVLILPLACTVYRDLYCIGLTSYSRSKNSLESSCYHSTQVTRIEKRETPSPFDNALDLVRATAI